MSDKTHNPNSDYDRFARLYDLEHAQFAADLLLYQNFARRCDGPVLDVGCGSGRVTLPLARAGSDVVGIDSSLAMLDIARARVHEAGLSDHIQLLRQDVCTLDLENQFALVVFSLNGFLHLLTAQAQRAALHNMARALLPGGILIVDVPNPHTVFTTRQDGKDILRSHFSLPQGGKAFCFVNARTDLAAQIQHITLTYDQVADEGKSFDPSPDGSALGTPAFGTSEPNAMTPAQGIQDLAAAGLARRTRIDLDVRFVYRDEMVGLIEQAGLQVDAVYGSYDLDPYEAGSHVMLFVAYRPL
ncbi:MAG: methyltransferase domain-containing protein [Anaerolineae bacterium]|nr:methyltransferase domain-containing protein [Anaerolineae bacterium]